MNHIEDRIWTDLVSTDYQAIYASIHNKKIRRFSDRVNLFTTFVSSASVGGWAIWSEIPGLWGFLIAISQFINLARPYISSIRDYELYHELQLFYRERHFELDDLWLKISMGDLTEDEIKNSYQAIYQKFFNLSKKFLKVTIEKKDNLEKIATKEWEQNLKKYGIN